MRLYCTILSPCYLSSLILRLLQRNSSSMFECVFKNVRVGPVNCIIDSCSACELEYIEAFTTLSRASIETKFCSCPSFYIFTLKDIDTCSVYLLLVIQSGYLIV